LAGDHNSAESLQEPSSTPGFRPGDIVGERYQLLELIGVGAMGAVFRAHDRVLDAPLAMKLIRLDPECTNNERATQRLLLEARAIARISHPGIVRVFDFGCVGGVPFIAMELLHGESLLDLMLREGPLDPVQAVRMMLPIADAISVAHRRSVVHRDIKPENVFLAKDEFSRVQPKLVDFGVARVREGGSGLTRPGALMGTPDYMAPEQAQAEPDVDHRADVWAFAVVLYELMTLRRPFSEGSHASYLAVLKAIVSAEPRPLTELSVGDDALWGILAKALVKDRSQRFQSVRALGEALSWWLLDRGVTEDAYGSSLRSVWLSGDHDEANQPPSSQQESITLRRASPAAAAPGSISDSETLPPPAVAAPPLLALPLASGARELSRVAEASGVKTVLARRFVQQGPGTLPSTRARPLSPLALAVIAAAAAAITTAAMFWWLFPRAAVSPRASVVQTR
jgi:serine/threonine protein kinase